MSVITANIKVIMLVSGVLTTTMIYAAVFPEAAMMATFGETFASPATEIVVRNWGALITLVGAFLIYGAFKPEARNAALAIAGISKLVFVVLVLSQGALYLGHQAGIAVAVDSLWVVLFATYVFGHGLAQPKNSGG